MAGVIGSTDITGTNAAISGTSDHLLNPINTGVFSTGDVVTQIDYYLALSFAGTDRVYEVGLYSLSGGSTANGSTKVWSKQITVANGFNGWISVPVSSEAITATNGDTLAVALSSAVSGSGNATFKQGATSSSKSHAASGVTLLSPWTETTTSTRQLALTVTTSSGSSTPIAKLSSVTSPSSSSSSMSSRG